MPNARHRSSAPHGLVLADTPSKVRLRALQAALSARRDDIGALDLRIENLRSELQTFERQYQAQLAGEHDRLRRIERMLRQIERWTELLSEAPREEVPERVKKTRKKRHREVETQRVGLPPANEDDLIAPAKRDAALKAAYRALARRYHPDLARNEEERIRFGDLMARINALYESGDIDKLVALQEQDGAPLDEVQGSDEDRISALEERLQWFESVLQNLKNELAQLERCATYELSREAERLREEGRELVAEVRGDLVRRIALAEQDIPISIAGMEAHVEQFNRQASGLEQTGKTLDRFEPHADKQLVRLGLQALTDLQATPAAERYAEWLLTLGEQHPALLRVVMLAYVSELSPLPISGLERFDDLRDRYLALSERDEAPLPLERALVELDTVVEYGVKQASAKQARTALHFLNDEAANAMPLALRRANVRREFRRLLLVLGEREACSTCRRDVFTIPLYRLRGLDDLRGLACPRCSKTLRSYWMPKGKDVQSVLNTAFLDFEIVVEANVHIGRGAVAMQFLSEEIDTLSIGDLKQRIHSDIFVRNAFEIERDQITLCHLEQPQSDQRPLAELPSLDVRVRFSEGAPHSEADTLELLKHRIRTRWQ